MPMIVMPTRITDRSATLIDHMYFFEGQNLKRSYVAKSGNLLSDLTDHLPNFMILSSPKPVKPTERPLVRIFSENNIQNFIGSLIRTDMTGIYVAKNTNEAFDKFQCIITECFNDNFPLVKLSRKRQQDKKWITKSLKKSARFKNKLYKRWIKTKNSEDKENYLKYKRIFKSVSQQAESDYYSKLFDSRTNTIKQLWLNLNSICSLKSNKKKTDISKLCFDNIEITDKTDICNALNTYFCGVGQDLVDKLQQANKNDSENFLNYLPISQVNSMVCESIDDEELIRIINGLNPSKSAGYDNIGPRLLKRILPQIVQPLLFIFNLSFSTGVFPDALKIAKVVPIFKKDDPHLPCNYRPISLLSIFSKIMEKLMHKRLYAYLQSYKLLYDYQFGFRKHHGTSLALIEVIDTIYNHLDNKEKTVGIYLDLQKAFDTVNHDILIQKLSKYGIRGTLLQWFKSYLTNRKQFITIDSVKSDIQYITCGVPQGSVLGPLLFLIYINDIQNAVPEAKLKLFADDTNLFIFGETLTEICTKANILLGDLNRWFVANKLSLNVLKTCYSVFPNSTQHCGSCNLSINGISINQCNSVKYLGVWIDDKLKWQQHIDHIYTKLVKFIGIFYKLAHKLPDNCLRMIYYSFVHPHLLYGVEIYANTYALYLDKLIKLNNKLLRILQHKDRHCRNSVLYINYNTLPIPELHMFQIICLVHKFMHHRNSLPEIYHSYFIENYRIHQYNTRNKGDLHLSNINSRLGSRAINYKGCILWNSLPAELKNPCSFQSFKNRLKAFLHTSI